MTAARPGRPCFAATVLAALALAATAGAQTAPSLDAFGLLVAVQSRPSFAVIGAGARPGGMGGAFTALADDASAASFNPAGLALLLRPEASVVYDFRSQDTDHRDFFNPEAGALEHYGASSTAFATDGVNFAAFTLPVLVRERNLCFQISYHRAVDFTFRGDRRFAELDSPTPEQLHQQVDQNGGIDVFSLASAYQLTDRLAVGLTLSRWQGSWTFTTLTEESDGAESHRLRYAQENHWSGWNASVGALLRYRYLNVGASLRSGFDGDYDVDSRLTTDFPTVFAPSSGLSGTLHWPSSWTLGLALKPADTWFVTTDYVEYDWDDMVIEGLPHGAVSFFDIQPRDASRTRSTGTWRFGTEWTLLPRGNVVALRAGGFVEPRPQVVGAGGETSSTHGFTAGIGWKRGPFAVDVAYQRATSSFRTLQFVDPETVATGQVTAQAEGEIETSEERVFVAFLYQFRSRTALRDLFHFLFVGPLPPGGSAPAAPPEP